MDQAEVYRYKADQGVAWKSVSQFPCPSETVFAIGATGNNWASHEPEQSGLRLRIKAVQESRMFETLRLIFKNNYLPIAIQYDICTLIFIPLIRLRRMANALEIFCYTQTTYHMSCPLSSHVYVRYVCFPQHDCIHFHV